MHTKNKIVAIVIGFFIFCGIYPSTTYGAKIDVYLVYSGKNRRDKDKLKGTLSGKFKVKTYNADLLALADYTGKQKAVTKLSRARVVIILMDKPMRLLKGSSINRNLIVVNSTQTGVNSNVSRLYILAKGTNISGIGNGVNKLNLPKDKALLNRNKINSTKIVFVDQRSLNIYNAVFMIVNKIL